MHEIPMEVSIHRKKFRYIELSIHRNIGRGLLSIPWHPRVFYADTERKLTCIEHRNRVYLVSIFFFFGHRYRIELDCAVDTPHYHPHVGQIDQIDHDLAHLDHLQVAGRYELLCGICTVYRTNPGNMS